MLKACRVHFKQTNSLSSDASVGVLVSECWSRWLMINFMQCFKKKSRDDNFLQYRSFYIHFSCKKKIVLNQLTALEPAFKCTAITLVWVSKREVKWGHLTYLPAYKYTCVRQKGQRRCSALPGWSCCRGDFCSFRIWPVLEGNKISIH